MMWGSQMEGRRCGRGASVGGYEEGKERKELMEWRKRGCSAWMAWVEWICQRYTDL